MVLNIWGEQFGCKRREETISQSKEAETETNLKEMQLFKLQLFSLVVFHTTQPMIQSNNSSRQSAKSNQLEL